MHISLKGIECTFFLKKLMKVLLKLRVKWMQNVLQMCSKRIYIHSKLIVYIELPIGVSTFTESGVFLCFSSA